MVYLNSRNIKTTQPTKKFNNKQFEPYKVETKVKASIYKLKLLQSQFIHLVFNKILLKLVVRAYYLIQETLPLSLLKLVKDKLKYKVKNS